jgi:enamine deaminase RidA (YjgF/YER057c/UK114 family)
MSGRVEARLQQLEIVLPVSPKPVANYVAAVKSGKLVFVSGQIPLQDGALKYVGTVGADLTVEQGQAAARLCAINVLTQVRGVADLDAIVRVVRLGVFVNAVPGFTQAPEVANGASDLMVAAFGDAGRHARSAVGVSSLPRGVAVEVEAIFEIE